MQLDAMSGQLDDPTYDMLYIGVMQLDADARETEENR